MDAYTNRLYLVFGHLLCDEHLLPTGQTQIGIFAGWERLLELFLYSVEQRVLHETHWTSEPEYPIFAQIKEKFGHLRVYLAKTGSVSIADLIENASAEAKSTCYRCGRPASLSRIDGVVAPRCPDCLELDAFWRGF